MEIKNFWNFPKFNENTNADTDAHHGIRFIVENVEENDTTLKDIEEHATHGETFQRFTRAPKLNIYRHNENSLK